MICTWPPCRYRVPGARCSRPIAHPSSCVRGLCGSTQGSWDFLQDRRRVPGTIGACRVEQRPFSHLRMAQLTWNPTCSGSASLGRVAPEGGPRSSHVCENVSAMLTLLHHTPLYRYTGHTEGHRPR